MPFGDGTGPLGLGPGTGRGIGYCRSTGIGGIRNSMRTTMGEPFLRPCFRRIFGGFGKGRGWRNCFWNTGLPNQARGRFSFEPDISEKEEADILENRAEYLRKHLGWIENRLNTLRKSQEEIKE